MSTAPSIIEISCPHCGTRLKQPVRILNRPDIYLCNEEEGGCDGYFAATIRVVATAGDITPIGSASEKQQPEPMFVPVPMQDEHWAEPPPGWVIGGITVQKDVGHTVTLYNPKTKREVHGSDELVKHAMRLAKALARMADEPDATVSP